METFNTCVTQITFSAEVCSFAACQQTAECGHASDESTKSLFVRKVGQSNNFLLKMVPVYHIEFVLQQPERGKKLARIQTKRSL